MNSYGTFDGVPVATTLNADEDGKLKKSHQLICPFESISTYAPAIGSYDDDGYKLISSQADKMTGGLAKVTLNWEYVEPYATYEDLPETEWVESIASAELSIKQHPNITTSLSADWNSTKEEFKSDSPLWGTTSYIVGTVTVTKTTYHSTKPTSDFESVGTLESPGGEYTVVGNHWLLIGSNVSNKEDNLWVKQNTYLYSKKEFPTSIYS